MDTIAIWFFAVTTALAIPGFLLIRYMDKQIRDAKKSRKGLTKETLTRFYEGDET